MSGLAAAVTNNHVERWFASQGRPPLFDLARSGAAPLTLGQLIEIAGAGAVEELLGLSLDYGDPRGEARLRAAVVAVGAAGGIDEVLVTHGAVEALLLTCAAVAGDGGEAIVASPAYGGLLAAPRAAGLAVRQVPVWRAGCTELDLDRLIATIGPATRAVLVNLPHNPSGLGAGDDQLAELVRKCRRHGAILVVDEVARATLAIKAIGAVRLDQGGDSVVVAVGDVSKPLGLGGLRVGWLATGNRAIIDRAAELREVTTLGNAITSQHLAALALERRQAIVERASSWATGNLAAVAQLVDDSGGSWIPPSDGLVAYPRLPLRSTSTVFAEALRRSAEVAVVPGCLFGSPSRVRLGLGCDPATFAEAAKRIGEVLRGA